MLAHNKLGPIREERTLKEALAEYERIEREDVPAMRLDDKARNSDKVRGEELESALSVATSHCWAHSCNSPRSNARKAGARIFGSTIRTPTTCVGAWSHAFDWARKARSSFAPIRSRNRLPPVNEARPSQRNSAGRQAN